MKLPPNIAFESKHCRLLGPIGANVGSNVFTVERILLLKGNRKRSATSYGER